VYRFSLKELEDLVESVRRKMKAVSIPESLVMDKAKDEGAEIRIKIKSEKKVPWFILLQSRT